jgi:DNA polymerase-3 subunit epsilon
VNFVALDVETANSDVASICQIGIAKYAAGQMVDEWSSLIDPEDDFDFMNVAIHGITEQNVAGCPTLPEVLEVLDRYLSNAICVCHTNFDRGAIRRAFEKYGLDQLDIVWLDSASVARRAWKDCAWRGYGLANICRLIGYGFEHHDALEDAKACGQVMLAAIDASGLDIEAWLKRVKQPINLRKSSCGRRINRKGKLARE